jgi:hypothetical protein
VFGWFSKKIDAAGIEKHGRSLANKRSQAPDRWDSMQSLNGVLKDPKNAPENAASLVTSALLPRFTYYTDPTISDGEEKEYAFRLIVEAGEGAVEPVRQFMRRAESLTWPLKMLERLQSQEQVTTELLALLEPMDVDYERDPQRKLQILQALEERVDARIGAAVLRFVTDANETARFHAVGALLVQTDVEASREALQEVLLKEESARVKVRVLELFQKRSWDLAQLRPQLERQLPTGWSFDAKAVPQARALR